ncbi:MAG: alanine dehydrogenase [Gammaproteobacteria bacterium]|nr:alanine dehydrogenase [Gammaproteobacteria bacterium]
MNIGIPSETKPQEKRVALTPAAASELVRHGHQVRVQSGAGVGSGFSDRAYQKHGIEIVENAEALYAYSELIIKVKEPITGDLALLTEKHTIFSYLHLAALPTLTRRLQDIGLTAIAFETVQEANGRLPLLAPMSDIAGRLSVQIGTHLLHQPMGGKGILLGGVPATERGKVVILGAGVAGGNAALVAASMGANVVAFDTNREKMESMRKLGANVTALYPYSESIHEQIIDADLIIGAVLVTGDKTPHLVSEEMVKEMQEGTVIIDISVDQGGCIETTSPTTFDAPTFVKYGVTHFCVTNMPGSVARTSSEALSASLLPWVIKLASNPNDLSEELVKGVNVQAGEIIYPVLKELFA